MPTNTTNYNLVKPTKATDNADINVINTNMDTIDTQMKINADAAAAAVAPGAATDTVIGTRTIIDTVVAATGADTPTNLWSKLGNIIKQITGGAAWYTAPAMTIAAIATALGLKAPLASPALTGVPTAPTATPNNNSAQIANTAYADAGDALKADSSTLTAHEALQTAHGAVSAPTASKMLVRDASGRSQVAAPSAAADIARKDTVDAVQTNLTEHVADSSYQVATGTATALIVPMATLVNGYSKTFIASATSTSTAKTINGKPFYKPGTTLSPSLVINKAYTVWYNLASDCFFIKASAEGTATQAQVLANVPFSNEEDTGLLGTMPNRGVFNLGLGVNVPDGYYSGGTTANGRNSISGTGLTVNTADGWTMTATGLPFKPSIIQLTLDSTHWTIHTDSTNPKNVGTQSISVYRDASSYAAPPVATYSTNGFIAPVGTYGNYTWLAIE